MADRDDRRKGNDENEVREEIARERERQAHQQGRKPPGRGEKPEGSEPPRAAGSGGGKDADVEAVVERLLELPYSAQLSVLRSAAPQIIAHLDGNDQDAFLRNLESEVHKAARGETEND